MSHKPPAKPSNEVLWWSLFSAGGVMATMFIPAFVIVTGLALPTKDNADANDRYDQLHGLFQGWFGWIIVRGALSVIIFLCLFHCAHRIRHTLMDLGLRKHDDMIKVACYLLALAGTAAAVVMLVRL